MIRLTSAALLPPVVHGADYIPRLVAMVRPPRWVIDITSGRACHTYAAGAAVGLMDAAIRERSNPLLSQGGRAWDAYAAALDKQWSVIVAGGGFAPGRWEYVKYTRLYRSDGSMGFPRMDETGMIRSVPDDCYLVCTCREHEGCHLRVLAPHLVRAGHAVSLYGKEIG